MQTLTARAEQAVRQHRIQVGRFAQEKRALDLSLRTFTGFFHRWPPKPKYLFGRHTDSILVELHKASVRLTRGQSTHLIINVMYRHGKSDIVSRRFPVFHLCNNPDHEILLTAYNDELVTDLSRDARDAFGEIAPHYGLSLVRHETATKRWRPHERSGGIFATGLGGTITGRGAHVLIIDDYLKNREEAESQRIRDKQWDSYTGDMRTRLAPVHAEIIVATRQHEDDIVGRILQRNDPNHRCYDPKFPKFRVIRFKAWDEQAGWLFPTRFSTQWYEEQRAGLGPYAWNSEAQQDPRPREGNMFKVVEGTNVHILSPDKFDEMSKGARFHRGWDLASTRKERVKSDPDFTAGVRAAYFQGALFFEHGRHGQWTGNTRNKIISEIAKRDGPNTIVMIETVAGYTDAYDHQRQALAGQAVVRKFQPVTDKVARATCMEPFWEAGLVYLKRGDWNAPFLAEHAAFPNGSHDDWIDSAVTALHDQILGKGRTDISR